MYWISIIPKLALLQDVYRSPPHLIRSVGGIASLRSTKGWSACAQDTELFPQCLGPLFSLFGKHVLAEFGIRKIANSWVCRVSSFHAGGFARKFTPDHRWIPCYWLHGQPHGDWEREPWEGKQGKWLRYFSVFTCLPHLFLCRFWILLLSRWENDFFLCWESPIHFFFFPTERLSQPETRWPKTRWTIAHQRGPLMSRMVRENGH